MIGALVLGTALAAALGAANLGVAFGIGQVVFAVVTVALLTRG